MEDEMDVFLTLNDAFLVLKTSQEVENFLRDLCTPQEIHAMQERWRVCQCLDKGEKSYREIHQTTGASLTTITRVSRFMKDEKNGGYRFVLDQTKK